MQCRRRFRSDFEIVVDHCGLAVEQEAGVRQIALEHRDELVEQMDEADAEGLERRVPLTVPVRVRDDRDSDRRGVGFGHAPSL